MTKLYLKKVIEKLNAPMFEQAEQVVIDWLRSKNVDEDTIQELSSCSKMNAIRINNIYLDRFNSLIDNNMDEQNAKCIENGYLIIGSGLNGDPIVYSISKNKVGYVSHDELWEEEEDYNFEDIVYITKLSLSEFYEGALDDEFPVDICEAEEKGI